MPFPPPPAEAFTRTGYPIACARLAISRSSRPSAPNPGATGTSRSGSAYTATVAIPIARQVRMTRAAISPRLAIRIFAIRRMALHPEDAERVGAPDDLVERGAERDAEGGPRVARVDDAVVPDAGRRVERVRLLLDLLLDRSPHGLVLRLVVGLAGALGGPAPADGQHAA